VTHRADEAAYATCGAIHVLNLSFLLTPIDVEHGACSICEEFEAIAERALGAVATTEELMEMIDYIEEARTKKMLQLNQRVLVSQLSPCL